MQILSVRDAAQALSVSEAQVGRLIANGDIAANRFGRSWVIDELSLNRYRTNRPSRGRPLSSRSAWAAIRSADPGDDLGQLARLCRRRAACQRIRILPGLLAAALDDARVVESGAAAGEQAGAAVDSSGIRVVYIRASDLRRYLEDHSAIVGSAAPNVVVKAVPDEVWPFGSDRYVDANIAAIDLLDEGDIRAAIEVERVWK